VLWDHPRAHPPYRRVGPHDDRARGRPLAKGEDDLERGSHPSVAGGSVVPPAVFQARCVRRSRSEASSPRRSRAASSSCPSR
jgi:hypothetical protein